MAQKNDDLNHVNFFPGAVQLPIQPNTVHPPIALVAAGLQLWQQLRDSATSFAADGLTFNVKIDSEDANTAWKLSTYGGCTCHTKGQLVEVVLLTSDSKVGKYPTPPAMLPAGAQDAWRKLYALGRGSTTIVMSTDHELWSSVTRLVDLGAVQLAEGRGGKKTVKLIEDGEIIQAPAEARVVGRNNNFA